MKVIIAPIIALAALTGPPETQLAYWPIPPCPDVVCGTLVRGCAHSGPSQVEKREASEKREAKRRAVKTKAEQGDAEAQYELYLSGSVEEESKWLCRSAHGGHALAQVATGLTYSWGKDGKVTDPVLAYLWYSLAAGNGHRSIKSERDALAETMTPAQVTEAERLVAEWKPNPAKCESTTDKFEVTPTKKASDAAPPHTARAHPTHVAYSFP